MPRLILIPLFVCVISVGAQTLALRGVVTDPSGAVVPGVTVQLHGPGAGGGRDHRAKTDTGGRYAFTALAPGKYQFRISVNGFAPLRKDLSLAQTTEWNPRLILAAQKQEMTVEESADARAVAADPGSNGSAIVLRQRQLAALSDDPDELRSEEHTSE